MSNDTDSDEEGFVVLLALRRKKNWIHEIYTKRKDFFIFYERELESHEDKFFIIFSNVETFEDLHRYCVVK
jgi:energy-converting hydrogenase A subunit M